MTTTAQYPHDSASSPFESGFRNLWRGCVHGFRSGRIDLLLRRVRAWRLRSLTTDELASRVSGLEGWTGKTETANGLIQQGHINEFLIALGGGEREQHWFLDILWREFYPVRLLLQQACCLEITLTAHGDGQAMLRLNDDRSVLRETRLHKTSIPSGEWTILWLWSGVDGNDRLYPFIGPNRPWEPLDEADQAPIHVPEWVREGRTSGFVLYYRDGSSMDPDYSGDECYAADIEAAHEIWESLWEEGNPIDPWRDDSASLYILENGVERRVWAMWTETALVDARSDSVNRTVRFEWLDPELEAAFKQLEARTAAVAGHHPG
jgi:hypothetical protein